MVNAGSLCKTDLERRIGMQLDSVSLPDLLIPAHGNSSDTLYDTDVVQHILDQYLHVYFPVYEFLILFPHAVAQVEEEILL
jgi:hypothetical protein